MEHLQKKYGLVFPAGMPSFQIELLCAKHWREPVYKSGTLDSPSTHMNRAIRELLTREQFMPNRWAEKIIHLWCTEEFFTILGAGSTGKSNTIGLLALLDYLTDSRDTLTFLASTTRQMLEIRSYESVMRYWNILRGRGDWGVQLSRQRMALLNGNEDMTASSEVKAAVRGVAVRQGTVEEAEANLQGGHLPYVRLILDEMQATRPAAFNARHNLSIGTRDFKFVGLANPNSIYDLSCRASRPKSSGGWADVNVDMEEWDSVYGKCLHLDGLKSPALDPGGDKLHPHLIKKADIDRVVAQNHGNWDSPAVWTMIRGFPPPSGETHTVLSESAIRQFQVQEAVEWDASRPTTYGALDPAFTSGGDGCVFRPFQVGTALGGVITIMFLEPKYIELKASSDVPIQYQISEAVGRYCSEYGISYENLVVDETGTQRVSDVIEMQHGRIGWRYVGSARASKLPMSSVNDTPADRRYRNRVTEAWHCVAEFAQFNQIRGLDDAACLQLSTRRIIQGATIALESKTEYKSRASKSPDEADTVAMACQFLREFRGVQPGSVRFGDQTTVVPGHLQSGFSDALLRKYDLDGRSDGYTVSDL